MFEDLDIKTEELNGALDNVYSTTIDTGEVNQLLQEILNLRENDPDLNIIVRGDAKTHYKDIRAVLDLCQQANIVKVDLATEIEKK